MRYGGWRLRRPARFEQHLRMVAHQHSRRPRWCRLYRLPSAVEWPVWHSALSRGSLRLGSPQRLAIANDNSGAGSRVFRRGAAPDPDAGLNPTAQSTTCADRPCIDPDFAEIGGPTLTGTYWSAATAASRTDTAWVWNANDGTVPPNGLFKTAPLFVRAVRAGSCTD